MKTKKTEATTKPAKTVKISGVDVPLSIFKIGTKQLSRDWVERHIIPAFDRSKVPLTSRAADLAKRYSNDLTATPHQFEGFYLILSKLEQYLPDDTFTKEWSKSELDLLEAIEKAIEKNDKNTYTKCRDELLRTRTIEEINAIITTDARLRKYSNVQAELNVHARKMAQNEGLVPTTVYLSQDQIAALKKHRDNDEVGMNYEPGDTLQRLIGRLMGETAFDAALAQAQYNKMLNMYPVYRRFGV